MLNGTDRAEAHPLAWYAAQVRGRHECAIARRLERAGISAWVPVAKLKRRWSDRVATVETPLVPGYVFLALPQERGAAPLPGVLHLLGPIPPAEFADFRSVLELALEPRICKYIRGASVTVKHGAMAGQTGVVVRQKNETRLVVSLEFLRRSVSVELDIGNLQ